jgi:translocation and assembly module TamB
MTRVRGLLGRAAKYFVLSCFLLVVVVAALLWYLQSESFQRMVRGRITGAIEHATGGRAELGGFRLAPFRLQVEVEGLIIHGRESSSELPLVHVDRLSANVRLSSLLGAKVGFHSLTLEHPVVDIIFYPDGTSNWPLRPDQRKATDFEQLFSLSIGKLVVRRGELVWQDERLPLDFALNDLSASVDYSFLHRAYSGRLSVGNAELQFAGSRPVPLNGQIVFSVQKNQIEFSLLRVASGGSRFQASGALSNFSRPVLKADYDLLLDLAQAGAVARQPGIRSGKLVLQGTGLWSRDDLRASGRFAIASLFWRDDSVHVENASASGRFSLDPDRLRFSQVGGQLFRGSFSSDAEISGWPARGRTGKNGTSGLVRLKTRDMSLGDLRAGLGPRLGPFRYMKWQGNVAGESEMRWKNSLRNAQLKVAADVSYPARLSPGEIPLKANVIAGYDVRARQLEIQDLAASTPASEVHASGSLSPSGVVRFSFTTSHLGEWQPLTAALFPAGLPVAVHQRTTVNGTVSGGLANMSIAANVGLQNVDAFLPGGAAGRREPIHWDVVNGDIRLSSRSLLVPDAVLQAGAATVKLQGTAGLAEWKISSDSPLQLHGEITGADAAELARAVRPDLRLTGQLNSAFRLTGSVSNLEGLGTIRLSGGSIQGYSVDSATALAFFRGMQAEIKEFDAVSGASRISGRGTYDLRARSFHLHFAGHNFDLAAIPGLPRSPIAVGGRLDFSAELSGTEDQPQLAAELHLRSLTLNQELMGDYQLETATRGEDLHLTGHSDFKNAELTISGDVLVRDEWPARIDFHFNRLDVDSLLAGYLRVHAAKHSSVAGDLRLEGPLRNPRQLTWTGNLTDFSAEVDKVKLKNQGPTHFTLAGETLKVDGLHVVGDNADFSGKGWIELGAGRALDFEAQAKLGVALVQNYDPDFTGSGTLSGDARVTGTLDSPLVKGKLLVENVGLADINLPSALSDMNGVLRFSQNRITIESLTARSGGGTLSFAGHAELFRRQLNFDLNVAADAVRLRYPPGVSSTADAALHWSGSSSGSLLSGDITVSKLGVTPGFDFGAYLERSIQQSSLPQTDPVLNRIRLDLHVVTAPELEMQTSVLRMRGEADLRVRGSAAKPVLVGRADIFEGQAYFNGTKYRLERGGVTFTNPAVTTPFLDLEAVTHVRDYDITLSLNGDVSKPNGLKVNYRSEPPLPTSDIITLLAFGQTTETSAQLQQTSQSAFSQQASNALLAAALNATLNNRAQRLFGNSRIKIDPQGLETYTSTTQSGPAVTIEQQVKDNLTLSYTTNVSQTSQQIIRAEYNVSRNLSIVAIRDQNGVVSFDVKIRRRKR